MEKKGTIGDIELTELTIKTVTPLLQIFRPAWDISAVKVKVFSEGHINAMAAFYVETMNEESIVIRINGPSFGILDRARERKYQAMLQTAGIIEYVLGVFKNGIVMRNIPGSAITHRGNLTAEIESKIARTLAKLHKNVPVIDQFYIGEAGSDHVLSNFFTEMINMISHRDDINQKLREAGCADTHHIVKVIQELANMDQIDYLMTLQKAPIGTAHCDAHLDNFMYCKVTGKLSMIDLELMRPFPVSFDLAYHFLSYESISVERMDQVNSREQQAIWLKEYFNEMGHTGECQKDLIEDYLESIEIMIPIAILYLLLAAVFLAGNGVQEHQGDFDYIGFVAKKYLLLQTSLQNLSKKYKNFSFSFAVSDHKSAKSNEVDYSSVRTDPSHNPSDHSVGYFWWSKYTVIAVVGLVVAMRHLRH